MKNFILIMAFIGTWFGAGAQEDDVVKLLSPSEFKSCTDHPEIQLIDVRTAQEYNLGFIANAVNLDIYKKQSFLKGLEKLDKEKPVYVYCQAGGRSRNAANILKEMGFTEIYDLQGGYSNYKK